MRHWVDRLRGAPTTMELPLDRPRPAVRTAAGAPSASCSAPRSGSAWPRWPRPRAPPRSWRCSRRTPRSSPALGRRGPGHRLPGVGARATRTPADGRDADQHAGDARGPVRRPLARRAHPPCPGLDAGGAPLPGRAVRGGRGHPRPGPRDQPRPGGAGRAQLRRRGRPGPAADRCDGRTAPADPGHREVRLPSVHGAVGRRTGRAVHLPQRPVRRGDGPPLDGELPHPAGRAPRGPVRAALPGGAGRRRRAPPDDHAAPTGSRRPPRWTAWCPI